MGSFAAPESLRALGPWFRPLIEPALTASCLGSPDFFCPRVSILELQLSSHISEFLPGQVLSARETSTQALS